MRGAPRPQGDVSPTCIPSIKDSTLLSSSAEGKGRLMMDIGIACAGRSLAANTDDVASGGGGGSVASCILSRMSRTGGDVSEQKDEEFEIGRAHV